MGKKQKDRKPTVMEKRAMGTVMEFMHLSSEDVIRARDLATHEADATQAEIIATKSRLDDARARLARANARIAGLSTVLERR